MVNRFQRAQAARRDRGHRRVSQLTRWTAAVGGLTVAVIAVVLGQGAASASTTPASPPGDVTGAGPGTGLGSVGPDTSPSSPRSPYGPSFDGQFGGGGLQAPAAPPQRAYGSGPSVLSGGS